jgi:hypothetical protein
MSPVRYWPCASATAFCADSAACVSGLGGPARVRTRRARFRPPRAPSARSSGNGRAFRRARPSVRRCPKRSHRRRTASTRRPATPVTASGLPVHTCVGQAIGASLVATSERRTLRADRKGRSMPRGVRKSGMQRMVAELMKAMQELEGHLRHIRSVLRSWATGGSVRTKPGTGLGSKRRRSPDGQAAQEKAAKKRWAKYQAGKKKTAKRKS